MNRFIEDKSLYDIRLFDILYVELNGKTEYTEDDYLVLNALIWAGDNFYRAAKKLKRKKADIRRHAERLDRLALIDELGLRPWIGTARRVADVVEFSRPVLVYESYDDAIGETNENS